MNYNFQENKFDNKWIAIFCGTIIAPLLVALFLNASGVANRTEIVSNGYIIMKGKLLKHPYKIVSDGENITINGEWYDLEYNRIPLLNLWAKSHFWKSQSYNSIFDSLISRMKRGGLEIIFDRYKGGSSSKSMPFKGSESQVMVDNISKVINSDLSVDEKRKKIIEIFNLLGDEEKYVDDFLNNWNS